MQDCRTRLNENYYTVTPFFFQITGLQKHDFFLLLYMLLNIEKYMKFVKALQACYSETFGYEFISHWLLYWLYCTLKKWWMLRILSTEFLLIQWMLPFILKTLKLHTLHSPLKSWCSYFHQQIPSAASWHRLHCTSEAEENLPIKSLPLQGCILFGYFAFSTISPK